VEQLATRESQGAPETCVNSSPHPWLTLYRWPRGLGRSSRRFGSPTWTPKPSKPTHTFPPETFHNGIWKSHLEDLPPLFGAPPPPGRPGQPRWLAPQGQGRRAVGGTARNLPEPSRSFQDLPGPTGTVSGHSGHFWSTSNTFRDL
jgi:hypothetical protein